MGPIVEARDRWLGATPAARAEQGPAAMATCARALVVLADRLAALRYPVDDPLQPCPDLDDELAPFAEAGFVVPPALVALWREVGSVCFVDLGRYRHVAFWNEREERWRRSRPEGATVALAPCCDGIVVDGPVDGWVDYALDTLEAMDEAGEPLAIEIAPDDLHKDNISGSGPYEVLLPDPAADPETDPTADPWLAPLEGFGWVSPRPQSAPPGRPDLVSYLRTAVLECGGFPGLHGHPAHAELLRDLTADLPVF